MNNLPVILNVASFDELLEVIRLDVEKKSGRRVPFESIVKLFPRRQFTRQRMVSMVQEMGILN